VQYIFKKEKFKLTAVKTEEVFPNFYDPSKFKLLLRTQYYTLCQIVK